MKKELFKNIIGYDDTKKTLERLIDVLNNQEKYKKLGSTIPHGLFLYGPPGLGKTTFSKEILKNVNRKQKDILVKITKQDIINNNYRIGFNLYQLEKTNKIKDINKIVDQNTRYLQRLNTLNQQVETQINKLLNR